MPTISQERRTPSAALESCEAGRIKVWLEPLPAQVPAWFGGKGTIASARLQLGVIEQETIELFDLCGG